MKILFMKDMGLDGIAILMEILTDNKNRTLPEIKKSNDKKWWKFRRIWVCKLDV